MLFPDAFAKSYLGADLYPSNLLRRSCSANPASLKSFVKLLDDTQSTLCTSRETDIELPIRDLANSSGRFLEKCNIHHPQILESFLGIEHKPASNNPAKTVVLARRKDPKCRFVYFHADHSRARLRLFRRMMTQILTFHQVMPAYLDFVLCFGAQAEPQDLRFSGFREQTMISDPPRGMAMPELGRSGRQFQLCYNLKNVALKTETLTNPALNEWSIRQAAIHHQFDVVEGTMLWIVTKGNRDILDRYKEMTAENTGSIGADALKSTPECFRSSLDIHLLFCHWSTEGWRWYIRWLEGLIRGSTEMAAYHATDQFQPKDIMALHRWEDKAGEVMIAIDSNIEVISSLRTYYLGLLSHKFFPFKTECEESVIEFIARLDDTLQNFKMEKSRAELLLKNSKDRKELVVQHLQTQASERMETVSYRMEKEAVKVRIITVVTLIYLPATFVSTLFSTDIIKYQGDDGLLGKGRYSSIAMERWLEVTLSLTAITLFGAWIFARRASFRREGSDFLAATRSRTASLMTGPQHILPTHNGGPLKA